ncbi:calmodulin-like [Watersipora subatra]|uniref:calmodulin-like n=1 Tax=Watersipora subatra TaxID=2589382 RepID=UPI00355BECE2
MGGLQSNPIDNLTQEEISELTDTFNMFDDDGSGTISTEELGQVMRALGQDPTVEELEAMVEDVDEDGSGSIEVDEFIKMMAKRSKGYEKEVKMTFKSIHNGGFITKKEIKKIYSQLGENLSDKDIQLLLNAAGADSEGRISYKQFSTMMKEILEEQK